jgi:hypothetical protein
MKRQFLIIPASIAVIFLFSCNYFPGNNKLSGEIVSDQREVPDFEGIDVSSGIDVILSQGNSHRVVVKADKEVIDNIVTEVHGGILKIYSNRSMWRISNITVEVTFVTLNHIKASAGSDIKSDEALNFNDLTIDSSSGSDITLNLTARSLDISASSGSDAKFSGKTGSLSVQSSSGSDFNAYDLQSENVEVTTSSGSDVRITALKSIQVNASGGSDVYVQGNPQNQKVSTSGGSDVHFR